MKVLVTALLRSQMRKCRKSLRARKIVNWNHRGSWIQKRKPMLREQKKFQEVSLRDLLPLGEPETRLWAYTRRRDETGTSPWRQVALILAQWEGEQGKSARLQREPIRKPFSLCPCLKKKLWPETVLLGLLSPGAEVQIFITPEVKKSLVWELQMVLGL